MKKMIMNIVILLTVCMCIAFGVIVVKPSRDLDSDEQIFIEISFFDSVDHIL